MDSKTKENLKPKKESKFYTKWWFWVIIGFVFLGVIFSFSSNFFTGNIISDKNNQEDTLSLEDVKSNSIDVSYDNLFRHNKDYEGKIVHFKGQIIQVQDDEEGGYVLRIATGKSSYGDDYYEDIIMVGYKGERFLEGDLVDLYGYSVNLITYEAIMGNSITIPGISALYILISPKEIKSVATLGQIWASAENFDSDSEIDGLKFSLEPKDINGNLVEASGNVNIKLWKLKCTERSEYLDYCLQEECVQ